MLGVELAARRITTASGTLDYDVLVLACGAQHAYFGHEDWEEHAPGLKTLEQATEIRRRVLSAFEDAEKEPDPERKKALLTFVIVGGGPTGVELAGAIGEMSRFTLARDFRQIDPKLTRVILIEAGPRILPSFCGAAREPRRARSRRARRAGLDQQRGHAHRRGRRRSRARAHPRARRRCGPRACCRRALGATLGVPLDPQGRVLVEPDL